MPHGSSGAATWAMGSLFERLVNASDTGGQLGVSVVTQPSGAASPLHVHTREAEAWYVLDGEMTYVAGTETVPMVAGDFIYLPRNVPHAFRVTGATAGPIPGAEPAGPVARPVRRGGRPGPGTAASRRGSARRGDSPVGRDQRAVRDPRGGAAHSGGGSGGTVPSDVQHHDAAR